MPKTLQHAIKKSYQRYEREINMIALSVIAGFVARYYNNYLLGKFGVDEDLALGIYSIVFFFLFVTVRHFVGLVKKNKNASGAEKRSWLFYSKTTFEADDTRAVIHFTNTSNNDYKDVIAEIIDGDGVLDPRFTASNLPTQITLYLNDGKSVSENTVWRSKTDVFSIIASYDRTKGNIRFHGKNTVYFIESGSVELMVQGKKESGERDTEKMKISASVNKGSLKVEVTPL